MAERQEAGIRLRALRKTRGYTLFQLSRETGLTQQTLSHYETGAVRDIPLDDVRKLAAALKVPETELLDFDQTPESDELMVLLNDLRRQPREKQEKAIRILRMLLEMKE